MNLLSLFSGCGGLDIGFEGNFVCLKKSINTFLHPDWISADMGDFVRLAPTMFEIVFANDIIPEAKACWEAYFGKKNVYKIGSIVDLVKRQKCGENIFPKNIDVITGGFPCQDFSVSGRRLGLMSHKSHDGSYLNIDTPTIENRGHLYLWMLQVISIVKPKLFVAENVKGLTNLADTLNIIQRDFSMICDGGYLVVPIKVLNAKNYGVPQSRERVIFFGFLKSNLRDRAREALSQEAIPTEYDPYPQATHGNGDGLIPIVNCADALIGLDEPENSKDLSQKKYSKAQYIGGKSQGQTEIDLYSTAPTIRAEHHGNIEYRRLSFDHGGNHYDEINNGLAERRLSVRECARLQSFPDDYQFVIQTGTPKVSASTAYKLIGNAVPCLFAYNIAKNLESKWSLYFK